jgi:hypothetical protein
MTLAVFGEEKEIIKSFLLYLSVKSHSFGFGMRVNKILFRKGVSELGSDSKTPIGFPLDAVALVTQESHRL